MPAHEWCATDFAGARRQHRWPLRSWLPRDQEGALGNANEHFRACARSLPSHRRNACRRRRSRPADSGTGVTPNAGIVPPKLIMAVKMGEMVNGWEIARDLGRHGTKDAYRSG